MGGQIARCMSTIKLINNNQCNQINELYQDAVTTGCAPANYCKVQILGDEGVGKTSLLKNLMGEKFDPQQPSTVGIDTRMCSVKEVDANWQERKKIGDFEDIVGWVCSKAFWKEDESLQQMSFLGRVISRLFAILLLLLLTCTVLTLIYIVDVPIERSLSLVVWVSLFTLLATKEVKLYLFLNGLADIIFTLNMTGYLIFDSCLPKTLWCFTAIFMTTQLEILGVFQTWMGRSVILGVKLLSVTCHHTERWQNNLQLNDYIILALSYPIGHKFVPLLAYFSRLISMRSVVGVHIMAKLNKRSRFTRDILAAIVLIIFSIVISTTCEEDLIILATVGVGSGVGGTVGVAFGKRIPHSLLLNAMKHPWLWLPPQLLCGWILIKLSGNTLPFQLQDCLNVLPFSGIIPLIVAEVYRNHLLDYNVAVVNVAHEVMQAKDEALSLNLSLWDFAGQKLYYHAHHTFMSAHAVYVVVFNLKDFRKNDQTRSHAGKHLKFWMDSVKQHANSCILLVGTHRDCVDRKLMEKIRHYLKYCLHSYNPVVNRDSILFAVDNSKKMSIVDDIGSLRREIRSEAQKRLLNEFPIRWRRFNEFIAEWRSEPTRPPFIMISELKAKIVAKIRIETNKELIDMLTFFHDNGEIIYDSVDSVLRQYVVLDPQVMIDIMEAFVVVRPAVKGDKMYVAWRHLERTGILKYSLLEHIIVSRLSPKRVSVRTGRVKQQTITPSNERIVQVIIGMLQAKDLICKIERERAGGCKNDGATREEIFVVPSILPSTVSLPPDTISWNKRLYIDFGQMLPSAVFLRLMSRCASYSDIVSLGQDQCQLFSDGGIFTLGTQYLFMLRKLQPCNDQYLVEVSIKSEALDWHPLEVLQYLCSILDTLRCRDFPGLQFTAGLLCPCEAPHQGCDTREMKHILDLHTEMKTEESILRRRCNGRRIHTHIDELDSPLISSATEDNQSEPITVNVQGDNNFVVVGGNQSRIVINRGHGYRKGRNSKEETDIQETSSELGIDAYISCSPHDEGWVQETLVRYLRGPPHYLTVRLNRYDVPTQPVHVRQQNVKQIEKSGVFFAVCSRYYRVDPTGRLTFEREVARRCGIPIIGINRDCAKSRLSDMFDVDEVSFSSSDLEVVGRSLDLLSGKVLDIISKLSN